MTTYLLTWNPRLWLWDELQEDMASVKDSGAVDIEWSTGVTKRIVEGDRAFLVRLEVEPKGIMGAGFFSGSPEKGLTWRRQSDRQALYAPLELNVILPEDKILPIGSLSRRFNSVSWTPQASGQSIPPQIATELEKLWSQWLRNQNVQLKLLMEGSLRRVLSDQHERNPEVRRRCIEHYGLDCSICDFNFGAVYGEAGEGLIHVHHLKPLGKTTGERRVDPIKDLRPVCANRRAVIHRQPTSRTIEEMRAIVLKNKS